MPLQPNEVGEIVTKKEIVSASAVLSASQAQSDRGLLRCEKLLTSSIVRQHATVVQVNFILELSNMDDLNKKEFTYDGM